MDLETKLALIERPPTEEIVTGAELRALLERKDHPEHYIGLEISGPLHLGTIILTGFKLNDFTQAGIRCRVFLADWHSYLNNKFNGDWERILQAAKYYAEAFRLFSPGVEMVTGSDLYRGNDGYWRDLVRFSKHLTLARNARCLTVMGRTQKDALDFGQYLYPPMQATDSHALDLDMVHSGMDQRKVHMLSREIFPKLRWKVPVAVHHHLLPGLAQPALLGLDESPEVDRLVSGKMSKSKPATAIFVHDTPEQVEAKLKQAWCPEGQVENNPVLELAHYVVFHEADRLTVERPSRHGGPVSFTGYDELVAEYRQRRLHPADLKAAVARAIDRIIQPLRSRFAGRADLAELFATA